MLWLSIAVSSGVVVGLVARWRTRSADYLARANLHDELRRLEHAATHDPLTGLLNHSALIALMEHRLVRDDDFAVLFCDIDRFKSVNDSFGHAAGDRLIATIARRLESVIDGTSALARVGGDEFALIVPTSRARSIADSIIETMNTPCVVEDRPLRVSVSIGVAAPPWPSTRADQALGLADRALRLAKNGGGDRVEVSTDETRAVDEAQQRSEHRVRRAIDEGRAVAYFQAEIDTNTQMIVGAEVLARWVLEDGSLVDAAAYLRGVVDAYTFERVTETVVERAGSVVDSFVEEPLSGDFRFRFNLPQRCAPRAWRDGRIAAIFGDRDLHWLTIDLCLSAVLDDPLAASESLDGLRRRGARVCLAEIGSAALRGLDSVGIDEIRIDARAWGSERPSDRIEVDTALRLARELAIPVSAVCVENHEQSRGLAAIGCRRQQGRLFHAESDADSFARLVRSTKHSFDTQLA